MDGLSRLFLDGQRGSAVQAPPAAAGTARQVTYLESPRLPDVARILHAVVDAQTARGQAKVILVLDQPDVLLAAAGPTDGVTSTGLRELVLDLREVSLVRNQDCMSNARTDAILLACLYTTTRHLGLTLFRGQKTHATLLTVAADEPLVSSQTTMLEKEHAAFVLALAHEAEAVLSLRMLDTGTAKDVSGVLRITRGGGAVLDRTIDEHEYLYHVGGDGGVKVLERG